MASAGSPASQAWHHALKLRKHLLRQLDKIKSNGGSGTDISQFEAVDDLLEKFRLACVQTIFLDFNYAVSENTEEALWLLHTSINSEYRRTLGRLKQSSHAVEKRKVERLYNNFLRIAQKFYKGYIQRLCARYDVPELKYVAQGIEVEHLAADDRISPVPGDLSLKVLQACHSTLLRLGDLARYRFQAKHKNCGYESVVTYYSLAHHLIPNNGFAFHQIGIVELDRGNHVDIVYHFYRAWAVEVPHPNAKSNLESEFKTLQLPSGSKSKNQSSAAQNPFNMWFVRLHALFYKGEVFQQQTELEGEVMHRLEMAVRKPDSANTLLKMAIINMSAFDIALSLLTGQQSSTSSRFCQFTLRFNCRFIATLCAALEADLKDESSSNSEDANLESKLSPTTEYCLPVLRIYNMWLAAYRREVLESADAFGPVVPTMLRNLAKVYSLLCVKSYNHVDLATCPYLLAEDLEARGLRPLSPEHVPEACRCYCREDGSLKTYVQTAGHQIGTNNENFARILDILRCAYFLAEDNIVPLTYRVVDNCLVFECQQEAPAPPQSLPADSRISNGPQTTGPDEGMPDSPATKQAAKHVETRKSSATATKHDEAAQNLPSGASGLDGATQQVITMLMPFLKPPTPQPQDGRTMAQDESYGMHTATTEELLEALEPRECPSSASSTKFESVPWAWFDSPVPRQGESFAPASTNMQRSLSSHLSPAGSPLNLTNRGVMPEDPFSTPGRQAEGNMFQQPPMMGAGGHARSSSGSAHREQLLQSFTNAKNRHASSSFGDRAQHQIATRPQPTAAYPTLSGLPDGSGWPASSGYSAFSHPSSLFQGTPMNGGGGSHGAFASNDMRRGQHFKQPSQPREYMSPAGPHFQIDETTLSYDEAILRAAYQNSSNTPQRTGLGLRAASSSSLTGPWTNASQSGNPAGRNAAPHR